MLLAKGHELSREIVRERPSFTGAQVETAAGGQKALERMARSGAGSFDLIFMDIQTPVRNGYAAARAIRALDRPDANCIPITAMTANAFAADIRRAQEAGMNGHVAKPAEAAKLRGVPDKRLRTRTELGNCMKAGAVKARAAMDFSLTARCLCLSCLSRDVRRMAAHLFSGSDRVGPGPDFFVFSSSPSLEKRSTAGEFWGQRHSGALRPFASIRSRSPFSAVFRQDTRAPASYTIFP